MKFGNLVPAGQLGENGTTNTIVLSFDNNTFNGSIIVDITTTFC